MRMINGLLMESAKLNKLTDCHTLGLILGLIYLSLILMISNMGLLVQLQRDFLIENFLIEK